MKLSDSETTNVPQVASERAKNIFDQQNLIGRVPGHDGARDRFIDDRAHFPAEWNCGRPSIQSVNVMGD
jgi:hypothetical protein